MPASGNYPHCQDGLRPAVFNRGAVFSEGFSHFFKLEHLMADHGDDGFIFDGAPLVEISLALSAVFDPLQQPVLF
jgi:hypothetical protein